MAKRVALAILAILSPLILVSFLWRHPAAGWVFAASSLLFPVALIALGAARLGRLGPLLWPLLILALVLEGAGLAILVTSGRPDLPWVGGFPLPAAIQIYALWLVPMIGVSLAYALTFDGFTLRERDLENLRRIEGRRGEPRASE